MYISKFKIHNYKIYTDLTIEMNEKINILVGENDSGKTTVLEALQLCLTGKINGASIMSKLTPDWFNLGIREKYRQDILEKKTTALPEIVLEIFFLVSRKKIHQCGVIEEQIILLKRMLLV